MLLTEEQMLIQTTARQFSQDVLKKHAAQWAKASQFPIQAIQAMGPLGFLGMLIPESWGGSNIGYLNASLVLEEIAAGDGSCSTIVSVHNSVASLPILHFGSDFQKNTFLKPMAQGKQLGAFCLTEPQAGSDAASLSSTAVLEGEYYRLNGNKQFVTSGKHANLAIVFAKTQPALGKKGITAFTVPTDLPGYEVTRLEKKMGQTAAETAQIFLNDLKIPINCRLGEEGEGYKIALSHLEAGRIGIAAQCIGMARTALEIATQYAKERMTFGKPIIQHQAIAFLLADMATRLEAARQLTWHAAVLKEANKPCQKEAAMAKLFASEVGEWVCREAIQVLGGYGYLEDFELERIYRDIRVATLYEGTSEIQKILISREL